MKSLFLVLFLILILPISVHAQAQYNNAFSRGYIELGGVTLPINSKLKIMTAGATTDYYDTFKHNNAAYVVPTGKKLIVWAVRAVSITANAARFGMGHGTSAVANSAAAPTASANIDFTGYSDATVALTPNVLPSTDIVPVYAEFAAGKYPYIQAALQPTLVTLFCTEEAI